MSERKKFMDIFNEDKKEVLVLKINLKIDDKIFNVNTSFRKEDGLAGIDFHGLRYLDLAINKIDDNTYEIAGFYPKNE